MKLTELNQGDKIAFSGTVREVQHVSLHPAGIMVVFKPHATHDPQNNYSAAYLESVGWTFMSRRVNERV